MWRRRLRGPGEVGAVRARRRAGVERVEDEEGGVGVGERIFGREIADPGSDTGEQAGEKTAPPFLSCKLFDAGTRRNRALQKRGGLSAAAWAERKPARKRERLRRPSDKAKERGRRGSIGLGLGVPPAGVEGRKRGRAVNRAA